MDRIIVLRIVNTQIIIQQVNARHNKIARDDAIQHSAYPPREAQPNK